MPLNVNGTNVTEQKIAVMAPVPIAIIISGIIRIKLESSRPIKPDTQISDGRYHSVASPAATEQKRHENMISRSTCPFAVVVLWAIILKYFLRENSLVFVFRELPARGSKITLGSESPITSCQSRAMKARPQLWQIKRN